MTMLTCKIPEKLDAQLDELARHTNMPKASLVRKALEHAVKKKPANRRAISLINKLGGSLRGPADLATNPRYLEGMGA